MARGEAVLNFRVPADPLVCRVVRDGVTDFARAQHVGEDDLTHFLTALGEAVANAIEHARSRHPIAVQIRLETDRIVAHVEDDGIGFTSDHPASRLELPPLEAERGRGLAIMRRCSDIFVLDSVPGKGTSILVGRFLHGREPNGVANVA